jgi:UDP-4-amino-4,6-dideoxy-N-acetyl-beta-L-altrosamine transaminase
VNSGPLPYGRHLIEDDDIAAVVEVLRGDWLTTGPAVASYEEAFAAAVGARFAVACNSGTAGLHLASLALGLAAEVSVAVPTNTFVATANAARYVGAGVRFTDVDPETGLMRPQDLAAALARPGPPAAAVYPVHFAGRTVDMEGVAREAQARGLAVVEDACHALGTVYRTDSGELVKVGSCRHSAMAVFSMHPVKTITMGEGGVVTTNDEALYRRLIQFRTHGISQDADTFLNHDLAFDEQQKKNPWYYEAQYLGFNYRASDINCALGKSQLKKLDKFAARRQSLADRYDKMLAPLAPLVRPLANVPGCVPALHLYVVLVDFAALGLARSTLMEQLRAAGIGSQVHYIPVHQQPLYRGDDLALPGSAEYYRRCLSLPLFPAMTDADVDAVVAALAKVTVGR